MQVENDVIKKNVFTKNLSFKFLFPIIINFVQLYKSGKLLDSYGRKKYYVKIFSTNFNAVLRAKISKFLRFFIDLQKNLHKFYKLVFSKCILL